MFNRSKETQDYIIGAYNIGFEFNGGRGTKVGKTRRKLLKKYIYA